MNKTLLFLTIFFISLTNIVISQNKSSLHLKNGSIIYGKIIENIPDSIVKIKTECNNILVFEKQKIESINSTKNEKYKTIPYNLTMDAGIAGFGGSYDASISLLITGTYNFNEKYYVGITSGIEYFQIPVLPVAGELRADIFKRNTTPFIYFRGGYGFKLIRDEENSSYIATYKGGIMFGSGIGIKKRFTSEFAMTFSIGYRHQQTYESYDYVLGDRWNSDYERHYFNNRTTFRIGFIF
ncbi:MAG: hypothetical protein L3J35_01985 [Bacteroidales bacterium]|nr:hypothetical protein [Bacteroidales bacterium]